MPRRGYRPKRPRREVAKYKDGFRVATTIFEAAAFHYAIKVTCGACNHSSVFDPHQLWELFRKRHWAEDLRSIPQRFWCRQCGARIGERVKRARIELVREKADEHGLSFPDVGEWKRAVNRFRN